MTPKTSPPTAEAPSVSDAISPPCARRQAEVVDHRREDEGVEHHVEGIEQPAHRGRHKRLSCVRRRLSPKAIIGLTPTGICIILFIWHLNELIDDIDGSILDILQYNARTTQAELAKAVGLAPSAVLERLRKLESKGIIRDYVALIDPHVVDRGMLAFVAVRTSEHGPEMPSAVRALAHSRGPRGPSRRRRRLLPAQGPRARCRASRSDSPPANRRDAVGDVDQDDDRSRDGEGGSAHRDSQGTDVARSGPEHST